MKLKLTRVFPVLLLVLLTSCSGYSTVQAPRTSTVPPGTSVPFARVINPGFAEQYVGADVITEVQFFAPTPSQQWQVPIPRDHMVFQVVAPGGQPGSNPLSREPLGEYVVAPKSFADLIFSLRPGDILELRGGTIVRKTSGIVRLSGADVTLVVFQATSVRKKSGSR